MPHWTLRPSVPSDGFECFWIVDADGREIATVNGPQTERNEARARMVAAAPDLLKALAELVRLRDWCAAAGGEKGPLPQDVIRQFALLQIPAIEAARAALRAAGQDGG